MTQVYPLLCQEGADGVEDEVRTESRQSVQDLFVAGARFSVRLQAVGLGFSGIGCLKPRLKQV